MSKPSANDILSNIQTITTTIQKLETQEAQRLQLIKSKTDIETNKQEYITINSNKWKCIKQMLTFKRHLINKNVLDIMKASSPVIKSAVHYVKNVDTPSMAQINLINPTFNIQLLNNTIINLKSCGNNVQKDGIIFVNVLQNEWNNNIKIRNTNIIPETIENEKQFQNEINKLLSEQLISFTKSYNNIEKQRISLLHAKSNVLIFMTCSLSDILYKLMLTNGQFTSNDIKNEINKIDSNITQIKNCMKNIVNISNELSNEITICNQTNNKQKSENINKILVDIGFKLANLQRALLTLEDIKMDNDISKYFNNTINNINEKIKILDNNIKSFTINAKNYIKIKQKNNAKNMLARRKLCVLQKDEYKRKLNILQNAMEQINSETQNDDNNNIMEEIKMDNNDEDNMSEVSSVNTDDLDKIVETNNVNNNDNDDDKILDNDYTKWDINDIVLWIMRLKIEFLEYENVLKKMLSDKNIVGGQFGMLNKNDLQLCGINENDAIYICKQIEQLVSCYNEDLMDEMYDDDELTGEIS